jgi:hypothetical protein
MIGRIPGDAAETGAEFLYERVQFVGISPIPHDTEPGRDEFTRNGFSDTGCAAGHDGNSFILVSHIFPPEWIG